MPESQEPTICDHCHSNQIVRTNNDYRLLNSDHESNQHLYPIRTFVCKDCGYIMLFSNIVTQL